MVVGEQIKMLFWKCAGRIFRNKHFGKQGWVNSSHNYVGVHPTTILVVICTLLPYAMIKYAV